MTLVAQRSISVVFPAHNEEANIAAAVDQAIHCLKPLFQDWEVIVVNDGSQDRTGEIIDRLSDVEPRLIALHHRRNQGYGAALKSGIQKASKELVFFCDSDLQFHLSELLCLLTWIEQYDLVIGYRVNRRDPWHRRLFANCWNLLVRLVLGLKVRDIDCAFKLFRRYVFSMVRIDAIGAMVNTDILVQATRMGLTLKEIPVTHFPRQHGEQSGANIRVILKAFRELWQLHHKLRNVRSVVVPHDRRRGEQKIAFDERRQGERRQVQLPINFPDRRRRFVRTPDAWVPLSFTTDTTDVRQALSSDQSHPLNIAMAVASPFPANHGTPGSIREMSEAIAATGHRVHVVTYHYGDGMAPKGVDVHRIPAFGRRPNIVVGPTRQKPFFDLLMIFTLCCVIRRYNIDVVHAHNYEGALVGYVASRLTRRPLVYHAINTMGDELASYEFFPPAVAKRLARALDHWVPRLADRIIAISDDLVRFLQQQGIDSRRVQHIPIGVDLTAFQKHNHGYATENGVPRDNPTVIYTGTLDRFQRIDYLLQAMRVVVQNQPLARLLVVPSVVKDDDLKACLAMIDDLGLQAQVDLLTQTTFDDIPGLLSTADVAVLPRPNCPGLPLKLLNYLAAGVPTLAFEGSAKGLKHLQQAFLVQDHDSEALGRGILAVLASPQLASTLGQGGQAWVQEQFSWLPLARQIEGVYNEVLDMYPRRRSLPLHNGANASLSMIRDEAAAYKVNIKAS